MLITFRFILLSLFVSFFFFFFLLLINAVVFRCVRQYFIECFFFIEVKNNWRTIAFPTAFIACGCESGICASIPS